MKKFITSVLLFTTSLSSWAAPFTDVDKAQLLPKNKLSNPGAESLLAGWSASGGTLTTTGTVANVGDGKRAFSWDSNAASQTLSSTAVSATLGGLTGSNGVASCRVKAASGSATHLLQAYDGSVVLASQAIATSTSSYNRTSVNFIWPSSGSVKVRLISVNANEPQIFVDDCYLGLADGFNLGQISQAQHYGSISITNCTGTTQWTTGGYSDQSSGGTACTYTATGNLSQPSSTSVMGFRTAFPPGEYLIVMGQSSSLSSGGVVLGSRISDGTHHSKNPTKQLVAGGADQTVHAGDSYALKVASALSLADFKLQYNMSGGNINSDVNGTNELTFDVYKFPTQTQTAMTFDTLANSWSGNHGSNCSWTTSFTSLVLPAIDASCTFTETNNVNFGTVTSYNDGTPGNNYPGIVFTPSRAGTYFVCGNPQLSHNTNNEQAEIQLEDISSVKIASAWMRMASGAGSDSASATVAACGTYKALNTSPLTLRMRLRSSTGVGTAGISASGQSDAINWTIAQIDQQIPAPVLVGGVVSSSAGVEHIERALISGGGGAVCSSDPCTIESQSGGWVSVANRGSAGVYTLTLSAGTFSSTPVCTVASNTSGALVVGVSPVSSTSISVYGYTALTPTAGDAAFGIICQGPK